MEETTYTVTVTHKDDEDKNLALDQVFKQIKEGYTSGMDRAEDGSSFHWSLTTQQLGEGT